MGDVEAGDDRDVVGEVRGEPEAEEAEDLRYLEIVIQRLDRLLVLLQHRAAEQKPGGEDEQQDPGDPDELARRLVGGGDEGADHVQHQGDEEDRRQPVVEASDQLPGEGGVGDVGDADMRPGLGGVVELGQVDAGDDQQHEADQGDAPERVGERVGVARNRVAQAADAEAIV